jgi:hypothetical protein
VNRMSWVEVVGRGRLVFISNVLLKNMVVFGVAPWFTWFSFSLNRWKLETRGFTYPVFVSAAACFRLLLC